jgi:ribosomal protein L10
MAKKVFSEQGLAVKADNPYFAGTTMYAYSSAQGTAISELCRTIDTEVNGAKTAANYKDKIVIKGAFAEGQPVAFDIAKKMPTRVEAIANVLGLILSPARRIAGQLLAPGANLAAQIKTISEKEKAGAGA